MRKVGLLLCSFHCIHHKFLKHFLHDKKVFFCSPFFIDSLLRNKNFWAIEFTEITRRIFFFLRRNKNIQGINSRNFVKTETLLDLMTFSLKTFCYPFTKKKSEMCAYRQFSSQYNFHRQSISTPLRMCLLYICQLPSDSKAFLASDLRKI